jgi:PAS domain S-box-containing protein
MKILNVEDNPRDSILIERELSKQFEGVELFRVDTPEAFSAALGREPWDLIVADHRLPRFSSLAALAVLEACGKDIPLVVVSGTMGLQFAVDAMRAGARDYLVKSELTRLCAVVEREVNDARVRKASAARQALLGEVLAILGGPGELPGQLRGVLEKIRRHVGADAAGIRLRVKDDFPYAMQVGFDDAHLAAENSLCVPPGSLGGAEGDALATGPACLCGAVLRQPPSLASFLTDRGALVSGSLGPTLETLRHARLLPSLRGRCSQEDYRSLALLPVRSGKEVVGLLQLNARSPDCFTPEQVQALEELLPSLGMAVERRRAVEALRTSEERYRVLVETSPDGIALTGLDGAVLKLNQRLATLLGVEEAASLEGRSFDGFVAEEDRPRAASELASFIAIGRPTETLLRFRHGAASFEGEVTRALTSSEGAPAGLVVVVRDVTERRQLQARLAQSERMASVGMLAAGVAHEINNPLTYVLANLESLGADLPAVEASLPRELAPPELVERTREALEGARRIKAIVRDLKSFSRAADERIEPVSIDKVIGSVLTMTQNEVKYRATVQVDYGAPPPVLANEGRLAQVFLNLVVNAAQSIGDGDVQGNRIAIRTWTDSGAVFVEVRDSGCGIPLELQGRVFEPFFTTKPAGIGTGLGLAISRGIVEEAGGRLSLESRPGEGSRFLVQLPAASPASAQGAEVQADPGRPVRGRRGRLLVVDDEAIIRSTLLRLLKGEHDVVLAGSGGDAERLLASDGNFDLILSDLIMPEISGMDLYEGLMLSHPDLAARMVFMTGGAFTQRAHAFLESVPNMRIDKPFDSSNLRELVRLLVAARPPGPAPPG